MKQKTRHIVSYSLAILLLLPLTVKLFDGVFHQHHHPSYSFSSDSHFGHFHKKCPIPGFELSLFSTEEAVPVIQKHLFPKETNEHYRFAFHRSTPRYSFLLRAPPFLQ